jgi:hypothetical protein
MISEEIYHRFARNIQGGAGWTDRRFSRFHGLPKEARYLLCTDVLEFEIANGGLPQLLWNTYFHWRWLLLVCEGAYSLFGADAQKRAIPEFRRLLDAHDSRCRARILESVATGKFRYFELWMEEANPTLQSEKEKLFYSGAHLQPLKEAWFVANEARIRTWLGAKWPERGSAE